MRPRRLLTIVAAGATASALALAGAAPAGAYTTTPVTCAQPDGRVSAIALSGGVAYLGGRFTTVRDRNGTSQPRAHLAAVDLATCSLTGWRADTDGEVTALAVSSGVVYAGGSFTTVQGAARSRLAGVTTAGGLTGLDGRLDGSVLGLAVRSGVLYAGGTFRTSGGAVRNRLAAWSTSGNGLTGWAPTASAAVEAVATDATRVYVGGDFAKVGGDPAATHLAALDPTSGAVLPTFRPRPAFPVRGIAVDSSVVAVAGAGGGGRLATYRLDGTLARTPWQTDGDVQTVTLAGSTLVAGGHFARVCLGGRTATTNCADPVTRKKGFAVDRASGTVTGWGPRFNSAGGLFASAYDAATGRLWVGGDFTTVDGRAVPHLAVF
ncbi:hypothetical protein [Lapillicoccus jejuensis]|uniref:Uncharacterized protein n=1 Tax=Lapillicoccus jejuensis TaxID=402171 RepID=A0A542E4D3_9MICO|nr:hypothetical protein [Lapillicoccus jejuensis]TQJ10136.1 hypothetical protein FB458_3255 [Lapillicoccus jejuensis]